MDCQTKTHLFYDLPYGNAVDDEDGYDLDDERDPIRCVLCRKYPRGADNEPIECEDCQTTAGRFYWVGKHEDIIVCEECNERGDAYH
jgi:hypothetical protein